MIDTLIILSLLFSPPASTEFKRADSLLDVIIKDAEMKADSVMYFRRREIELQIELQK
jgi:hypothetical protein